jgi:bifunctional DNA-binding transcriptional regulator/antitoxin component of YhaV-PrlF toxin-antitoxin module
MKIAKRVLVPGKLRDKLRDQPGDKLVPTRSVNQDTRNLEGYEVASALRNLLQSNDIPASARVTAARTLAEIEGLIGRHQAAPERAGAPLSSLSRAELVSELERLRALFGMGLVG